MNIKFSVEERKNSKVRFMERFGLSGNHWYGFLPIKVQYYLVSLGIRLGIIRKYGKLMVEVHRGGDKSKTETVYGYNIIPDVSIQHIQDILDGTETTNLDIAFMEAGTGVTTPVIGDTDTETALTTADRLATTSVVTNATTPFDLVATTFINSTKYDRPQTITELCIFWAPDESGDLFARGLLASGIVLSGSDTATLTYGVVWR